MKKILLIAIISCFINATHSQNKKKKDQNAIKSMCGCFEVTFNFAETFNYSESLDYKPSKLKNL